ncbi:unnamed protein product, partial [Mesorhabditis belari]|uniref:RING-type domain-containing protein n=1 Tax=Mesorhabditis belari TaxID=2138241 RepID=A0AAF3FKP0_9BILA
MSLRGQCIICYSAFTPTTVSALPCGHTFHEQCIRQWLDTPGRGCPNCRGRCRAKDVTRIFFDMGGLNDTLNVTTQESGEALLAKNEDLQARLDDVAAKESKAKKDLSMEIDRRIKLETLAASEKRTAKKATQKLVLKEAELLQVRSMLHDVNETKSENKLLKQQLEASDFYKDLFRGSKPVEAIEAYINTRGDPDSGKFMELQSRALDAEKKKCRKMAQDLEAKNKRLSELEMEKKHLQEAVRTLTEECKHQGVTTPQNPKIKKLLALSPPRRDSLDVFNGSISDSVLKSAMRGKGPVMSFKTEATKKPTWSEEKKKTSNVDEFDKIRVPKGLTRRVLPSATTSGTMSFKNVMDGPSAVKTKNVSKSGSDGLGGSIHRLGDRALTRIENAPSSSSSVLGRSSLPLQNFATKRPAPVQSISEALRAKKKFTIGIKSNVIKCNVIKSKECITLD